MRTVLPGVSWLVTTSTGHIEGLKIHLIFDLFLASFGNTDAARRPSRLLHTLIAIISVSEINKYNIFRCV
jgi:hypothetical protein